MEEEEEACSRRAAVRQLKQRLLEAVQANDGRQVEEILCRREIDVDAVLEVEDPAMVLASYKQGEGGGEGGGGGGGGVTEKNDMLQSLVRNCLHEILKMDFAWRGKT